MKISENCRKMYRLHLKLLTGSSRNRKAILQEYGKVKKALSRDLVVPSDITLHALHYAIQRAFGWESRHLHHFSLDAGFGSKKLCELTGDKFGQWGMFCGRYFRTPSDYSDRDEMADLYWDDDYDGETDFKAWLRTKYTGPYAYEGMQEHYLYAHRWYTDLVEEHPEVPIPPTFSEFLQRKGKKSDPVVIPIQELTIDEAQRLFDSVGELLERLRLDEVLATDTPIPENVTLPVLDPNAYGQFQGMLEEYMALVEKMRKVDALLKKRGPLTKKEKALLEEPDPYFRIQELEQGMDRLLQDTDGRMEPLTDILYYVYDYGDDWELSIQCTDVFTIRDPEKETEGWIVVNRKGKPVTGKEQEQVIRAAGKHTVKCLAVDGVGLFDDVGGVTGFCELLMDNAGGGRDEESSPFALVYEQGWTNRLPAADKLF